MSVSPYEESPDPLTDNERRLMKRMFSDFFEVPTEWKAALRSHLENDPPILGKITLGYAGTTQVALSSLASAGEIGNSGVTINNDSITLGGDVYLVRSSAGVLDLLENTIRIGTSPDVTLIRSAPGQLDISSTIRLGAAPVSITTTIGGVLSLLTSDLRMGFPSGDIRFIRAGTDQLQIPHYLLVTLNPGTNLTPLILNENGTNYQVRVGPAGSGPGGSGRMLWIS